MIAAFAQQPLPGIAPQVSLIGDTAGMAGGSGGAGGGDGSRAGALLTGMGTSPHHTLEGHQGPVTCLAFTDDGTQLISGAPPPQRPLRPSKVNT